MDDRQTSGLEISVDVDISSIFLPPSLFETLQMKATDETVGLVFTRYSDAVLFPLAVSENPSLFVASSVIGATVVSAQPIQNLSKPIIMEFKLEKLTVRL